MHEYSLVQAMFHQIDEVARAQHALSVKRVHVRIGDGAGVEPALFHTAYDVFRVDTLCSDASLDIESVADSDELMLDRLELEVP